MPDCQHHWQSVYAAKPDAELSWFQLIPHLSISLIQALGRLPRSVIDVGGGQSLLAGGLLELGVEEVAVLDISRAAIERGRQRLGTRQAQVRWIEGDVRAQTDLGSFELWHDRACFHFLTDPDDRRRYVDLAARTVAPDAHAIIAAFGPAGPERCSGLPVRRWSPEELAEQFSPAFAPVRAQHESHATPWGKQQDFVYVVLRRATTI